MLYFQPLCLAYFKGFFDTPDSVNSPKEFVGEYWGIALFTNCSRKLFETKPGTRNNHFQQNVFHIDEMVKWK